MIAQNTTESFRISALITLFGACAHIYIQVETTKMRYGCIYAVLALQQKPSQCGINLDFRDITATVCCIQALYCLYMRSQLYLRLLI